MSTDAHGDVILTTHYWSQGPASALDDYLSHRAVSYLYIAHSLFGDGRPSVCRRWQDGVQVWSGSLPGVRGPRRFLSDLTRTLRWIGRARSHDLFIAGDNLLALAGLYLRRRGRVRSVVLFTIDFVPNRFSNPVLNRVYHAIDRFAVRHVDVIWNAAEGIAKGRRERDGAMRSAPDIVVPVGAWVRRIREHGGERPRAPHLAYLGHVLEKQGLQAVVEALPTILTAVPDARLLVIGDGPYLPAVRALAARLGVEGAIEFMGATDDHELIEERLSRCSVGVAPYVTDPDNYSQFTDLPGKIKNYLACGLAVVTTDVPAQAALIESAGAGRVVAYDPAAFAQAIVTYLSDPALLASARDAATAMADPFDWNAIFDRAFEQTAGLLDKARVPQRRVT